MSDVDNYDTGVLGDSEESESTHTHDEHRRCECCESCVEVLVNLERWMDDAFDDTQNLDLDTRKELFIHFCRLIQHLINWRTELIEKHGEYSFIPGTIEIYATAQREV